MFKAIASLLAVLTCGSVLAAGSWRYGKTLDEKTERPIIYAFTQSKNKVVPQSGYAAIRRAELMVVDHPRDDLSVIVSVRGASFPCSSIGCDVNLRYGNTDEEKATAYATDDGHEEALYIGKPEDVLRRLMESGRLRVRAHVFEVGTIEMDFDTTGLRWKKPRAKGTPEQEAKRLIDCFAAAKNQGLKDVEASMFEQQCKRKPLNP